MEKRLPLALLLSFLILFGWQALLGPRREEPKPATGVDEVDEPDAGAAPQPLDPPPAPVEQAEAWSEWLLIGAEGDPGRYWARFDNRGAVILDLRIEGYYVAEGLDEDARAQRDNWVPLALGVESAAGLQGSLALRASVSGARFVTAPLEDVLWRHEVLRDAADDPVGVRFTHDAGKGVVFTKEIRTIPGRYGFAVELALQNSDASLERQRGTFLLTPSMGMPRAAGDSFYVEPRARCAGRARGGDLELASKERDFRGRTRSGTFPPGPGEISFAGVDNKYFALLLRAADEVAAQSIQGAGWRRVWDPVWVGEHPLEGQDGFRHVATDLELELSVPAPGQTSSYAFVLYAGPKDRRIMRAEHPDHARLIEGDLGFFDGIASLLLAILGAFHRLTGNWGFSIILLTLFVRIALFPFNRRSQVAMARHQTKMKRIQPRLDEIKKKYEKDPKRLRQEQAKIMQEEGAFPPLGGCLPIFVQIPIFFGLFSALRVSFDLRQAPFIGWIRDLSAPDHLLRLDLDTHLPIIGTIEWLNILPPLMVVLWIVQQKVMPKPTEEQALRMHKMMMFMPIMFGFFLYNYAAGLSLYMITTSSFGILEQTVIKKIWPIDATEQLKKKSGFMQRLAELQSQAQQQQQQRQRQQRARPQKKGGGRPARAKARAKRR